MPSNTATGYQNTLKNLPGSLGPIGNASWPTMTTTSGVPYGLAAQPLYYSPSIGEYVTANSTPASLGSVSFSSFGFGKKSRRSGSKSRRSGRKSGKKMCVKCKCVNCCKCCKCCGGKSKRRMSKRRMSNH